ncbi:dCTP deaminase [Pseudonocardia sp. T1-2H]|uniref:dCTP deaminase n=1 Tax=Pseudonocardia sp. T1-2H TaxID=3128899 RepID=UPI003100FC90
MYLPDHEIEARLSDSSLVVEPYEPRLLQPASLDVRLASTFRVFACGASRRTVELGRIPDDLTVEVDGSAGFTLAPGEFALGSTLETVGIPPDLVAKFEGRSTIGRLGLLTHVTAGYIDPGYQGQITLELRNVGPLDLVLTPGDPIGQLAFQLLTSPCRTPYGSAVLGSKYQGQRGPTAPRQGRPA